MRNIYRTFCALMLLFCGATANASLIQDLYYYSDNDPDFTDPIFGLRVTFPGETGCVEGTNIVLVGDLDCSDSQFAGLPEYSANQVMVSALLNSPPEILLSFDGGFWDIDENWFLVGLDEFEIEVDEIPAIFNIGFSGGEGGDGTLLHLFIGPYPQAPSDRLGTLGASAPFVDDQVQGEFLVVASPAHVPTPATLTLFSIGLIGLGWSRRKKA